MVPISNLRQHNLACNRSNADANADASADATADANETSDDDFCSTGENFECSSSECMVDMTQGVNRHGLAPNESCGAAR